MQTRMAPFPTMKPRACENPDCKPKEEGGNHRKGCTIGAAGVAKEFEPRTPWQRTCCASCRNRLNYLEVRRPAMDAELAARGAEPKRRGRPKKNQTPPASPPTDESGNSSPSNQIQS